MFNNTSPPHSSASLEMLQARLRAEVGESEKRDLKGSSEQLLVQVTLQEHLRARDCIWHWELSSVVSMRNTCASGSLKPTSPSPLPIIMCIDIAMIVKAIASHHQQHCCDLTSPKRHRDGHKRSSSTTVCASAPCQQHHHLIVHC